MESKFPIKGRKYHVDQLLDADVNGRRDSSVSEKELAIRLTYHATAINYIDFGAANGIDGPAAMIDGKPVEVDRFFQLAISPEGKPVMRHITLFPEYTLERFDVNGVTLRDVTIFANGDKIGYRIPDTIDQGGAFRQFKRHKEQITGDMLSKPVLKSDFKAAVELHAQEGGISE